MHVIHGLVAINGFLPKTGNLGSPDKSSGISAGLTEVVYRVSLALGTLDHHNQTEQLQQKEK